MVTYKSNLRNDYTAIKVDRADTEKLKASPLDFERLRADYQYRNEP